MSSELLCLSSFANWPRSAAVSGVLLAAAGFSYEGSGESTTCGECQLTVDNWRRADNPIDIHSQRSPNCPFLARKLQCDTVPASVITPYGGTTYNDQACDASSWRNQWQTNSVSSKDSVISSAVINESSSANGLNVNNAVAVMDSATSVNVSRPLYEHNNVSSLSQKQESSRSYYDVNRSNPDYALLQRDHAARLSTFSDWSVSTIISPTELADAGLFYTGQDDRVQCAFCHGYLRRWEHGDVAMDEHRRHFPDCPFLLNRQSGAWNMDELTSYNNGTIHVPEITPQPPLIKVDPRRNARHPEFVSELRRMESFQGPFVRLPQGQSVEVLAKAGFFYVGPEDNVKCYCCNGGLMNWQSTDEPWTEHERHFPQCPHLISHRNQSPHTHSQSAVQSQQSSGNAHRTNNSFNNISTAANTSNGLDYVETGDITERLDSTIVESAIEMGFNRELIEKVIEQKLHSTGDDFPNFESLLEAILDLQERETDNSIIQQLSSAISDENTSAPVQSATTSTANTPTPAYTATARNSTNNRQTTSAVNNAVQSVTNSVGSSNITSQTDVTGQAASASKSRSKKKKKKKKKMSQSASASAAASAIETREDEDDDDVTSAVAASNRLSNDPATSLHPAMTSTTMLLENMVDKLREERTCKVCMDLEIDTVYLPCGHFVCCSRCSQQLRNCPICRVNISATIKASMN